MPDKEKTFGPWDTVEGLDDDFDFNIEAAYFGFMKEYMDGEQALLIWTGSSPDSESTRVIWPVGRGWEVVEGGEKVTNEKRDRFVKTSMYGRLIDRVVKDLHVDMSKKGSPVAAAVWNGLSFHLKRETIEFKGLETEKPIIHLMPTSFLGEVTPGKGKTAAAVKAKVSAPATSTSTSTATVTTTAPAPASLVEKKLAVLAKSNDLAGFQGKALDMPEVSANESLLSSVLDDGPDGFWSSHRS